ncbi:ATP-dependent helicase [Angustibacter sp. McL0619]|uniref:ATP-dependent helicase n=1 Tax=Angustibacter sp. McL0619 TaxID=3415676 RepID=UPI003CF45DD3
MSDRPSAVEIARALGRPEPTPEQVAVIEAPPAPLLVVAGAGSGKTETMAARVVWLVAGGDVAPDEVLGLTFTRKAAGELSQRIRSRLRSLRRGGLWVAASHDLDVTVSTYHAFAGRLVREHGMRLGIEPEAQLLTEASCWQVASEVVEGWLGDMDSVDFALSTVVDAVLALSGECAEHLVDPDDLETFLADRVAHVEALPYNDSAAPTGSLKRYADVSELLQRLRARRQLLPIVRAYSEAKRARDRLDFGDQLALAAELATSVPLLAEQARDQYRAVLLDEFQDTSHAQLVMLEALFGGGHGVTAVGDPHQSIYGWRGASADTLAGFAARFRTGDGEPATVRHLSTSWRNPTAVLTVANAVAGPLRAATAVEVRDLVARPGAGSGSVQVRSLETSALEAKSVAQWLAENWLDSNGERVAGRTAAVLCRKRSQFTDVEAALLAAGLPYEVVGIGGLLSTPEVADLVCALHVVHDPTRGDLLMRLLTGPTCRLGAYDLTALAGWSRELHARRSGAGRGGTGFDEPSIVEALDELPPTGWTDREGRELSTSARTRLLRLADTVRGLRGRTSLALPDLVAEVERALLLDVEVASRPRVSPGQARAHLDALAEVAAGFEATAERATLGAFLTWLAAADEQEHGLEPGQVETTEHAIQVMTVHAAKGLEWDVVAVPGLVEGGFPQHRVQVRAGRDGWAVPQVNDKGWLGGLGKVPHELRGDRDGLPDVRWSAAPDQKALLGELKGFYAACGEHELAEERRLAYVAFTRAKDCLLLTSHCWGSALNPRMPSRFLCELVPGLPDGEPTLGAQVAEAVRLGEVQPMPGPGEDKPSDRALSVAAWPVDPLGRRRAEVEAGASLVGDAMSALPLDLAPAGQPDADIEDASDRAITLLLAERDRLQDTAIDVELPSHLSASRLVQLRSDPAALALALRRPMPRRPHPASRRGTAFHAWVERYLGAASILDVIELPGAGDDDADDRELAVLQERFLATEWASRKVVAVEVPVETPLDGTILRGRIDAVFARDDGGVDVVDWKTGPPATGQEAEARAVQLAVYRLAWHRLHGIPLALVGAAFCYVSTGQTVRPVDLLDDADLAALLRGYDGYDGVDAPNGRPTSRVSGKILPAR